MKCTFVVNQKVVCVIKRGWFAGFSDDRSHWPTQLPEAGQIYTVREVAIGTTPGRTLEPVISLKENQADVFFQATCFRPLNERPKEADTDISIFNPLLQTKELVD